MNTVGSGYDLLMIIWGIVFVIGAVGFIFAMNRIFTSEERRLEQENHGAGATTRSGR